MNRTAIKNECTHVVLQEDLIDDPFHIPLASRPFMATLAHHFLALSVALTLKEAVEASKYDLESPESSNL